MRKCVRDWVNLVSWDHKMVLVTSSFYLILRLKVYFFNWSLQVWMLKKSQLRYYGVGGSRFFKDSQSLKNLVKKACFNLSSINSSIIIIFILKL